MGFKIARNFTRTLPSGAVDNLFLTWRKILDLDTYSGGSIGFSVYENETEYMRKNQKDILIMPITLEQVQSMFSKSGNVAEEVSNVSWEIAYTTKFIPHWVYDNDKLVYVMELKSIEDLGGQIIDVGM